MTIHVADGGGIPPSGAAGGDLDGTFPNPGVAKVNGVAVTGTPAIGDEIVATSTSAAHWATPSGGGVAPGEPGQELVTNSSSALEFVDPVEFNVMDWGAKGDAQVFTSFDHSQPSAQVLVADRLALNGAAVPTGPPYYFTVPQSFPFLQDVPAGAFLTICVSNTGDYDPYSAVTLTDSVGNTYHKEVDDNEVATNFQSIYIFHTIVTNAIVGGAVSSPDTVTVGFTGTFDQIQVTGLWFTNVTGVSVVGSVTDGSGGGPIAATITPGANDLVVAWAAYEGDVVTNDSGAAWQKPHNSNIYSASNDYAANNAFAWQQPSSSSPLTWTTSSDFGNGVAVLVAYSTSGAVTAPVITAPDRVIIKPEEYLAVASPIGKRIFLAESLSTANNHILASTITAVDPTTSSWTIADSADIGGGTVMLVGTDDTAAIQAALADLAARSVGGKPTLAFPARGFLTTGLTFSRAITLKFADPAAHYATQDFPPAAAGSVFYYVGDPSGDWLDGSGVTATVNIIGLTAATPYVCGGKAVNLQASHRLTFGTFDIWNTYGGGRIDDLTYVNMLPGHCNEGVWVTSADDSELDLHVTALARAVYVRYGNGLSLTGKTVVTTTTSHTIDIGDGSGSGVTGVNIHDLDTGSGATSGAEVCVFSGGEISIRRLTTKRFLLIDGAGGVVPNGVSITDSSLAHTEIDASDVVLEDNRFSTPLVSGVTGVWIRGYGQRSKIRGNHIVGVGLTGASVGLDMQTPVSISLSVAPIAQGAGHNVTENHIEGFLTGVRVQARSENVTIHHNTITDLLGGSSAVCVDVKGGDATYNTKAITITENYMWAGSGGTGVFLESGGMDEVVVVNNNLRHNTAPITDSSGAAHKIIGPNLT